MLDITTVSDEILYAEVIRRADLTRIPMPLLRAEYGRRAQAKRKTFGAGTGRPKTVYQCVTCDWQGYSSERRKHHCTDGRTPELVIIGTEKELA